MNVTMYYPARMHRRHGGFTLVYVLILWVALCGFVSLAVDWGRVQLAKTQLQGAASTAARAAGAEFKNGVAAAQAAAVTWAGRNSVDGSPVVVDANNDVIFGLWDSQSRTFTTLSGSARASANSLQVVCRRTSARGTGMRLWFGGFVGANTCDVTSSSIVCFGSSLPIVATNTFTLSGDAFTDSYSSSNGPYASQIPGSDGTVASNTNFTLGPSTNIRGDLWYGTGSAPGGGTVTGTKTKLTAPLSYPATPLPATYTEHGAVNLNGNGTLTLDSGNHHLSSLTANPSHCKLILNVTSGPVRVWCDGDITLSDKNNSIQSNSIIPAQFELHLPNASTIDFPPGSQVYGVIDAPSSTLNLNGSELFGRVVAKALALGTGDRIHVDASIPSGGLSSVK